MVCKGVCTKYKSNRITSEGLRYAKGQKRCTDCEIFIAWTGVYCPCCGRKLKVKPRTSKAKRRMEQEITIKRI